MQKLVGIQVFRNVMLYDCTIVNVLKRGHVLKDALYVCKFGEMC